MKDKGHPLIHGKKAITSREQHCLSDNKPLKIAFIMSRFPKLTETFILYEILTLRELGYSVEFYPLLRENEKIVHPEAEKVLDEAHFHPFFSFKILRAMLYYLVRRPVACFKVLGEVLTGTLGSANFFVGAIGIFPKATLFARELEEQGFDHVHAHFATHPTVAALIIHRLTGLPFSFSTHGHDVHVDTTMLERKIAAASFAVSCSENIRDLMAEAYGEWTRARFNVVRYGVQFDTFSPDFQRVPSGPLQIVCVGSFLEVKGHRYLVEACRLLADRGLEFVCHLVGYGPLRGEVEAQIAAAGLSERFVIHGSLARDEVARLLSTADLSVTPSVHTTEGLREGLPNVIIEAMSSGLPVVSSQLSGIPEIVENGVTGILVPQRDSAALAEAMERLGRAPELRRQMGKAGREKVLREYDRKRNAALLGELFKSVAAGELP